ncbi:MAG: hypothetical protein JSV32_00665, partial [Dehalococcoidia bacterium]
MKEKQTTLRDWAAYDNGQTREKLIFMRLLNDAVNSMNIEYKYVGNGRPSIGMEDMLKIMCIKVYNTFSLRRTIPDLEFARALGYITATPHYNSIKNYFNMEEMTPLLEQLYRLFAMPFTSIEQYFSIDSTGFGRYNTIWNNSKYKEKKIASFNKLHAICGVRTCIITKARITRA